MNNGNIQTFNLHPASFLDSGDYKQVAVGDRQSCYIFPNTFRALAGFYFSFSHRLLVSLAWFKTLMWPEVSCCTKGNPFSPLC